MLFGLKKKRLRTSCWSSYFCFNFAASWNPYLGSNILNFIKLQVRLTVWYVDWRQTMEDILQEISQPCLQGLHQSPACWGTVVLTSGWELFGNLNFHKKSLILFSGLSKIRLSLQTFPPGIPSKVFSKDQGESSPHGANWDRIVASVKIPSPFCSLRKKIFRKKENRPIVW